MRSRVAPVVLPLISAALLGCVMPNAAPYRPVTHHETRLYDRARRDLLPEDVRRNPDTEALLAWSGILRGVRGDPASGEVTLEVEHRYWDWVLDFGTQSARILLSPRGEGSFHFSLTGPDGQWFADHAKPGEMLIVYGVPVGVGAEDQQVILRYVHARGFPESLYATDVWDYGRDFAVRGLGAPATLNLRSF